MFSKALQTLSTLFLVSAFSGSAPAQGLSPADEDQGRAVEEARIVVLRDGVLEPPEDPESAALALLDRINRAGPQRLIVGLRAGEPLKSGVIRSSDERARWDAEVVSVKQTLRDRLGGRLLGHGDYYFQSIVALPYIALYADAHLLELLLEDPEVISINTEARGTSLLNDTVPFIDADTAHSAGYTGSGYSVALIDTGVDSAHGMFSGKVVSEACYSTPGAGQVALCAGTLPSGSTAAGSGGPCTGPGCHPGHGSHVAGAAVGASVSPGGGVPNLKGVGVSANLVSIMAKSADQFGNYRYLEADVLSALGRVYQIAIAHQVVAVNMSISMAATFGDFSATACDSSWSALSSAAGLLNEVGVMVVAATGNSAASAPNEISPPACISNVVSVAATEKAADTFAGYANAAPILDLLAPAGTSNATANPVCNYPDTFPDSTWSAYPFGGCLYIRLWGTSVAAPHVSGAFAVLRHRYPDATPTAIRDWLIGSGTNVAFNQNGTPYNKPRINLSAALTPPSAPSTPASLSVASDLCYGSYSLSWSVPAGSISEYQLEASLSSGFSPSQRAYFGSGTSLTVDVGTTTYYRVRACNSVACSAWRNGGSAAVPLGYCL